MSADIEAWLAARKVWRPADVAGAPHVPTTPVEAARRFHCTRIAGSLTGEDCVNAHIRGTTSNKNGRAATTCTGCAAGSARQRLLQIEGSAKERMLDAIRLPADFHGLLGKVPDAVLAARSGVPKRGVEITRNELQIPAYRGPRRRPKNRRFNGPVDWSRQPLGESYDSDIAEKLWVGVSTVSEVRRERKIPRARVGVDWDTQPLGDIEDSALAERTGVTVDYVAQQRQARGIPPLPVDQECPVKRLGRLGEVGRMALAHISDLKDPAHDARVYLNVIAGKFGSPESIAATCGPAWDSRALRQLPGTEHYHKGIRYLMRCSVWVGEVEQYTQGWRLSGAAPTVGAPDITTAADLWVRSGVGLPMISLKHIMLLTHWGPTDAKMWLKREIQAGRLAQIGRAGGTMYRRRR